MKLLTFAYLGEAQVFIKELGLKFQKEGLYQKDDCLLLLSGEGPELASMAVASTLGRYPQIESVINMGIAGALSDSQTESIFPIRTVYAQNQFKSFTLKEEGLDLITSQSRVKNDEQAHQLSHFAPLVDRELWGVAHACHYHKIKLSSYKLVSDRAGSQTDCFSIKDQAERWSSMLFEYFQNLDSSSKKSERFMPEGYWTHSMKNKLFSLLDALKRKESQPEEQIFKEEWERVPEVTRPKDQSLAILKQLEERLSPYRYTLQRQFEEITSDLSHRGWKVAPDKELEKTQLHLQATLESKEDLDKLQLALSKFDFETIEKFYRGEDLNALH